MLYKGGPKNWSKNDWQFFKWMVGIGAVIFLGLIINGIIQNGGKLPKVDRQLAETSRSKQLDSSDRDRKIESVVQAGVDAGYDEDEVRRVATSVCAQEPECR